MTDKKIEAIIEKSVKRAFKELKDKGALKSQTDLIYKDTSKLLRAYFADTFDDADADPRLVNAIAQIRNDRFYSILPDFYGLGYTLDELSEKLRCDISTITRNKKRLCLEIYELMEEQD